MSMSGLVSKQLRMVNTACFPISYNDAFYTDVVKRKDEDLCKFAYHNGFVVGEICARVEPLPSTSENTTNASTTQKTTAPDNNNNNSNNNNSNNNTRASSDGVKPRKRIYIMTLGVLAAYRGRQIGTKLVRSVLDHLEEHADDRYAAVDEIVLHVQTSNEGAIKFYVDGFGFEKGEMVENYYKRIDPPHCFILRKRLERGGGGGDSKVLETE